MDIKIVDNSDKFINAKNDAVKKALEEIGLIAEGYAKVDCPVDTGRLRNSISHATVGNDEYIGSNVEYAPEVELDDKVTHKTGKAHFLRDAATNHSEEYKERFIKALKS